MFYTVISGYQADIVYVVSLHGDVGNWSRMCCVMRAAPCYFRFHLESVRACLVILSHFLLLVCLQYCEWQTFRNTYRRYEIGS